MKKQKQDMRMEQGEERKPKRLQEDLPIPKQDPEQYGPKIKKAPVMNETTTDGTLMLYDAKVEQ